MIKYGLCFEQITKKIIGDYLSESDIRAEYSRECSAMRDKHIL